MPRRGIVRAMDDLDALPLASAIRRTRLAHGLSQHKLAAIVGTGQGKLSEIEAGARPVTQAMLERIAEAVGETLVEVLARGVLAAQVHQATLLAARRERSAARKARRAKNARKQRRSKLSASR